MLYALLEAIGSVSVKFKLFDFDCFFRKCKSVFPPLDLYF